MMYKILTYLLICLPLFIGAQDKAYKEQKELNQTVDCKPGDKLVINGERSFIKIRSWDQDQIQLNVQVISKHQDQDQAKTDLEKIEVIFDKKGKLHTYSNSIRINDPKDKPKSNLKILLDLVVPVHLNLEIKNMFGEIDISGKYEEIKSNSQFTTLILSDVHSILNINTEYGDAEISNCSGILNVVADRSNLQLTDIVSSMELEIKYAELEMDLINNSQQQNILAEFSPLKIIVPDKYNQTLQADCIKCKIKSNFESAFDDKSKIDERQSVLIKGTKGKLNIKSGIEDISINFQNKQANSN